MPVSGMPFCLEQEVWSAGDGDSDFVVVPFILMGTGVALLSLPLSSIPTHSSLHALQGTSVHIPCEIEMGILFGVVNF